METKYFENENNTIGMFIVSVTDDDYVYSNYYLKYKWSSSIIRLYLEPVDVPLNAVYRLGNEGILYGFDGERIVLFSYMLSQKGDIVYLKIINEFGEYLYEDILCYACSCHVLDQSAVIQCPDNLFYIKHVVYDNDNPNVKYILLENLLQRYPQRFVRIINENIEELKVTAGFVHPGMSGRTSAQEVVLTDPNDVKHSFKYCVKSFTKWFRFDETWATEMPYDKRLIISMSGLITKSISGLLVFPKFIKD